MSPEEMSFRNLVEWHRDDLAEIMNGELATNTFTEQHHKYLVKHGVLRRDPTINRTLPTPEARTLLEDQSPNQRGRQNELRKGRMFRMS